MRVEEAAQRIRTAAVADPDVARGAIAGFVDALLACDPAGAGQALGALTRELRRLRAFSVLEAVCEACERAGLIHGLALSHHAQALIERGSSLAAVGLLQQARDVAQETGDTALFADAWALEGRVFKDLFVAAAARRPRPGLATLTAFVQRAAAGYEKAFRALEGTPGAHYPAVNLLAMDQLASREGLRLPGMRSMKGLAESVLAELGQQAGLSAWDHASAAEAAAFLGRWDQAASSIRDYIAAAGNDGFALAGTLRQMELLHGDKLNIVPLASCLDLLRMALISADGGSVQLTPADTARLVAAPAASEPGAPEVRQSVNGAQAFLEKVWGAEAGISHRRLQDVMIRARAVGRVQMQTEHSSAQTIGSGFLLNGEVLLPALKDDVLFLTNSHVVSADYRHGAPAGPGEAWVSFDASPELGEISLSDLLWSSPPEEHDVSVFRLSAKGALGPRLARTSALMQVADGLPHLHQMREERRKNGEVRRLKVPTTVYIIGYPMGQELSYSMRDNELVDQENVYGRAPGPEPRRIHYRAPTEPGNSGSPVFNSRTLQLIGIHHSGGHLERLNGQPGRYDVNEGLWLQPLLTACRLAL